MRAPSAVSSTVARIPSSSGVIVIPTGVPGVSPGNGSCSSPTSIRSAAPGTTRSTALTSSAIVVGPSLGTVRTSAPSARSAAAVR